MHGLEDEVEEEAVAEVQAHLAGKRQFQWKIANFNLDKRNEIYYRN